MEVDNLKKDKLLKIQKVTGIVTIITAIIVFIFALGFMTNLHVLLFDGTNEMYEYYKSIQVLNSSMFDIALSFVIFAFLLLLFDVNKSKPGYFSIALVLAGGGYTISKSFTMFKYIPHYKELYNAFDFSVIEGYTPSSWQFDAGRVLFLAWDVVIVLLMIVCLTNFIAYLKSKKEEVRGVSYES